VMTRVEGPLSQLGHPLYRQASLCPASSCRVAREDQRTGSAPASGVLLPAARCAANLRLEVRRILLAESKIHQAWKRLCGFPRSVRSGPRVAGILRTPHRFRTKRQLWTYGGVGIGTSRAPITVLLTDSSTEEKQMEIRGLNRNTITI